MVNASGRPGASRVAVVTGGSRGVGRETIRRLARLDYGIVVNYVHDQPQAEATVEAVLRDRGTAVTIRADVADELDVERLFTQTIETFGGVDAVVHAVRGHVTQAPLTELALGQFDEMCSTNIRSAFMINQAAARLVRNGGAIVNLVSSVDASASPTYGGYAITSAAIDALTRALARELRERDITVNAVSLDLNGACVASSVADAVMHLLGDDARETTGTVIHVDGRPSPELHP
jgi:3-oxoacyl-[acyl-carrier protein] reductase